MTTGIGFVALFVLGGLVLLAIVIGLLGALFPAVWAANLWPVQALRRR